MTNDPLRNIPDKLAANSTAWALGKPQRNGFHVRKVVWGLLMATAERRDDEQIRACTIIVEKEWKPRHRKPIVGSRAEHHEDGQEG